MHSRGNALPGCDLCVTPYARSVTIPASLGGYKCCFGDEEGSRGGSALGIAGRC